MKNSSTTIIYHWGQLPSEAVFRIFPFPLMLFLTVHFIVQRRALIFTRYFRCILFWSMPAGSWRQKRNDYYCPTVIFWKIWSMKNRLHLLSLCISASVSGTVKSRLFHHEFLSQIAYSLSIYRRRDIVFIINLRFQTFCASSNNPLQQIRYFALVCCVQLLTLFYGILAHKNGLTEWHM